ncbi:MAG: glycoside hydrolase family 92 protein, partial [Pedobacter sp.]
MRNGIKKLFLSAIVILGFQQILSAQNGNSKYVNPFIGTSGFGHTYPGATVPFGMVQLSPETGNFKWDYTSGYQYADSTIWGFAHTHLSGTGVSDLGDVLFLPFHGDGGNMKAAFSKKTEKASPGYYTVVLSKDNIKAELTASAKTGVHKYTFNKGGKSSILIDAQSGLVNSPREMSMHVLEGKLDVKG